MTMEGRVADLEIKISFLEDQLDDLNRTVFRQQQRIDLLVAEVAALREQVRNAPTETRSLRDDLPPHY
jgi:SlyX protein